MARFLNRSGAGRGRSLKGIAPAAAALLVLASSVQAGLSAPGTGSSTAAPSTAMPPGSGLSGMPMGQRSADAHFIVMMIPRHEGAIAMADLALQRSKRPETRALAERIRTSQSQENAQMRRWYRQWYGTDLPSWEPGVRWGWHHGGMMGTGMGSGMDPGMGPWMGTNLEALRQAADFDRGFIEQMIPHHQMGVMMATMELGSTQRPEMRQLAEGMIKAQSEEITAMQRWYRSWYR